MNTAITRSNIYFLITLIMLIQGIFYLKFFALFLLIPYLIDGIRKNEFRFDSIAFFYILVTFTGITSYLFYMLTTEANPKGAFLLFISLFLWMFYLAVYLVIKKWIGKKSLTDIRWVIVTLFSINSVLCLLQYISLIIQYKTLNPFLSELSTSAGDYIKGLFSNSSANLVINTFFILYFLTSRMSIRYVLVGTLVILFTSFMSGILCLVIAAAIHFTFNKQIPLRLRVGSLGAMLLLILLFALISYDNLIYAYNIIETVFSVSPPRKIVSFIQTFDFISSDLKSLLIGVSPGHFSSRIAFIAGGEYVNWYPDSLRYLSDAFRKNHFQLWNFDTLAIPFNDGTANQPFSVYNQLLSEYGIIGFLLFIFFYVRGAFRKVNGTPYALFIKIIFLLFLFLDYWFEYLTCMIFFELIIQAIHKFYFTGHPEHKTVPL